MSKKKRNNVRNFLLITFTSSRRFASVVATCMILHLAMPCSTLARSPSPTGTIQPAAQDEDLEDIFSYIDEHRERFLSELFEIVAQPSVSSTGEGIEECAKLLADHMRRIGLEVKIMPIGPYPFVFGQLLNENATFTLLIYGHYDIVPTGQLDKWTSHPYRPTIRNGRIYGRGIGDNKGQFFAHFKAVEAILRVCGELPVNLKFILDGGEELGSPSFREFVAHNKQLLAADLVYVADGPQHISQRPTVWLGLRGGLNVTLVSKGANRDLHAGNYSGVAPNPVWRMIHLLHTLQDSAGKVLIEGFYDDVLPPTPAERSVLADLPMDENAIKDEWGIKDFAEPSDISYNEKIMFQPSLNVALEGTSPFSIPSEVCVRLRMNLVVDQDPDDIFRKFLEHVRRNGFEDVQMNVEAKSPPFKTPVDHPLVLQILRAFEMVYQQKPVVLPTVGGGGPEDILVFDLGIPFIAAAYANFDEDNHAPNENLKVGLFYKGIKATAAVLFELGKKAGSETP